MYANVRGLIRHSIVHTSTMHALLVAHTHQRLFSPVLLSTPRTSTFANTQAICSWRVVRHHSSSAHRAHAPQHHSDPPHAPDTTAAATPGPGIAVLGQVVSAQANYVRVRVDQLIDEHGQTPPSGWDGPPPAPVLLCVVRALLKKIKQTVLVGDCVRVGSIDWPDTRGIIIQENA